ncbi:MAG: PIN domain-containing protein [Desulfosalsimonadaceae bacterium]|nr:PIN domain-containing protein [Desulfosalsimonadaceae bacterium]
MIADTSVWIDYFRGGNLSGQLDYLIDENLIAINDLILSELIPFLKIRNQNSIIRLLHNIQKLDISIDWEQIIEFQFNCLKNGLNGVGIPDLIIAQNAMQHQSHIYSLDSHFRHMQDILNIQLIG